MEANLIQRDERLRELEKEQAETKAYVKMIQEDIRDIRQNIREIKTRGEASGRSQAVDSWQQVVIELIKLASLSMVILGAIVGAVKIIGN
ncbi:chromosome segregation ATPase [Acetoanaerobium pronyense]|uniref:Chromosome segregation ATPase n=1 Tax=Acetoanaerobium pronyense TaxID=1482736 RepID=A0ABS4KIE2_9FIRM|nr:hypothetical protein [Acetoanaerobium pronyense]MBP2027518.1 chromosome segregation ATPase [Acetoanaerobium pronyense]